MIVQPVGRPTVRFVAVSENTSNAWWLVMLGLAGAVPWLLLAAVIKALVS
jgi:hypothetical protein